MELHAFIKAEVKKSGNLSVLAQYPMGPPVKEMDAELGEKKFFVLGKFLNGLHRNPLLDNRFSLSKYCSLDIELIDQNVRDIYPNTYYRILAVVVDLDE